MLFTVCLLLCLANKPFVDVAYKHLISGKYLNKSYKSLRVLVHFPLFSYLSNVFVGQDVTFPSVKNFIISLFFTYSTSRIFIGLFFLTCTHIIILFNNDFLASKNFIKDHVNRHLSQLIYDTNLFDNNFNLFIMFLTNFNSSVEFTVCSAMPSGEESYFMESSPPIYIINLWTVFSMVRDVSGGYSQTD